jgi:simple sugar transport system ATP-binding protein
MREKWMTDSIIQLTSICKTFPGGVKANDSCSLEVKEGEIHAIVGENGAGKTTLMNILFGLYQPDSGSVNFRGKEVVVSNPRIAKGLGIEMVHQHFMLVPSFTVLQNIILGYEPRKHMFIDTRKAKNDVNAICKKYGLKLPLDEKVSSLSVGIQQRVEIVKALFRKAEVLILDEPTAVLIPQEADELFRICFEMVKNNKTILFISHKLKEVMKIADRITVMRRGAVVADINKSETNEKELARLIIGEERTLKFAEKVVKEDVETEGADQGKEERRIVLDVKGLTVRGHKDLTALEDVSFSVHSGEVLGVAGVEGNGQSELLDALAGLVPAERGDIRFHGKSIIRESIHERRSRGLRYIPADRMSTGLCLSATIGENLLIDFSDRRDFSGRAGIINWNRALAAKQRIVEEYYITAPSSRSLVNTLSGGNMQKVVTARELSSKHSCLVIAHPTRGIDIGSADFIYRKIMDAKQEGAAILLVSADLDELFLLSDRLLVLYEGRITAEFGAGAIGPEQIGMYMTGAAEGEGYETGKS